MSLQTVYKELIEEKLNEVIRDKIQENGSVTSEEIESYILEYIDTLDFSVPSFDNSDFSVAALENASAAKVNSTFDTVKHDLRVLYKTFLELGESSTEDFERWKTELAVLEKRLIDLEEDIDNLLLLAEDTEGYHSYFIDNLTDLSYVDLDLTTVMVDTAIQQAYLSPLLSTGQTTTRLFLNDLEDSDVSFKVITSKEFKGRESSGNQLKLVFSQQTKEWKTVVKLASAKPVVCELLVRLKDATQNNGVVVNPDGDAVNISSIYIDIHDEAATSFVSITPLYSLDNYTFQQLPTTTYTIDAVKKTCVFNFSTVAAKYVKFILVKKSPDSVSNGSLNYGFGFKEIAFYGEAFDTEETYDLISQPISITDANGNVREFSKIALEVCERLEANTNISYYITPSDDPTVPVTGSTKWYPISPISHVSALYPRILDLSDVAEVEIGDTETVEISYDGLASDTDYTNPAESFHLLSQHTDDSVLDETITATSKRYVFTNSNERLLNYQIKDEDYTGSGTGTALDIGEDDITIFRNIGSKGLTASDSVRNIQRGWGFKEPYYTTIIEILNPAGMSIDVGNSTIIIDGAKYSNQIGPEILTGKSGTNTGLHEVKVHKDNWKHVTPDLDSIDDLKSADILYPYNHKLIIEGYDYNDDYPSSDEMVYFGVDNFFEYRMKQISLFDFTDNLSDNIYRYFTLDYDTPDSHTGGNSPTRVFLVKVDDDNPDSVNERFLIRFNLVNQRYSYLRFKATLSTEDETITPALDAYKLKFAD